MKNNIKKAYSPSEFRKQGHQLIEQLADYLELMQHREDIPISALIPPNDILKALKVDLSKPDPTSTTSIFQTILDKNTHLQHPRYMGHQMGIPIPLAGLAQTITGIMNGSGSIYEMGAAASAMDKLSVDFLLEKCEFGENANGILTSGGSLGNLTALLAARQAKSGYDVWEGGVTENLAVMVSKESHYSISRAVKMMGLGEKGLVKIPTNDQFQIDCSKLESTYQAAIKAGKKIIAVIGNACSTATGSFDDLETMATFCKKHQLWFHVDAAHGGGLILSEKYKHLLKGIGKADSVVIDFHKMMLFPSLVTAVLFQNATTSVEAFTQKAHYLAINQEREENWFNFVNRTIECTRPMMGVQVYTVLRTYGGNAIGEYVASRIDLAKTFAAKVQESADFELAIKPSCNIVCFRFLKEEDLNVFNTKLRLAMLQDGRFYIVQATIRGQIYLRISIMNPFTTIEDLMELLDKLRMLAKQF